MTPQFSDFSLSFHLDLWGVGSKRWKGLILRPLMGLPSSSGEGVRWARGFRVGYHFGRRLLPDVIKPPVGGWPGSCPMPGPPWLQRLRHSLLGTAFLPFSGPASLLLSKGSLRLAFKACQVSGSAWNAVPAQTRLWGPSLVAPLTDNNTAPLRSSHHSTLPRAALSHKQ